MQSLSHVAQEAIMKHASNNGRHSELSRFINVLMKTSDKRSIVERHVMQGLHELQKTTHQNPEYLFNKAIEMLSPTLDVCGYRRGAKIIRVPLPLTEYRSQSMAYRWLSDALRKNKEPKKTLEERFVTEILSILEGKSSLLQKKSQLHREALTNRSFAKYRWPVNEHLHTF